ncbi:riboflavin synthase [Paenimyroides tangerinum]|uniref:Riboflavin synthase n=1 Tax=Paenimyroides tangerinum TaxID=2488728 RepID=A0A3P3WCG4_9FLAO|nr:riboflavin synthase [Paenimyroides tangerinum]RRJ92364.1 riboflavin synthase [Paenimyroides tangerinum]
MFTGIVETFGEVKEIVHENDNVHLFVQSKITNELKIDQSVAHNGVCLTVVEIKDSIYKVTAIKETVEKTTIGNWQVGNFVNLERAMLLGARLDGHIVQGHVDQTAVCVAIEDANGSIYFTFEYDFAKNNITIEKGSITVDGTSLTVVNSGKNTFSVAIIPYTLENTLFKTYKVGTQVNLEFDVVGKYVSKLMSLK